MPPLFRCSDCQTVFEPPFDSQKFRVWMDACVEVDAYLCLECADLELLKDMPACISIADEERKKP